MRTSKLRTALVVFFIGFALGLSVFAASRLVVRSVLSTEATAAAQDLATRLAEGERIDAAGTPSIIRRFTYIGLDGDVLQRAAAGPAAEADAAAASPEMRRAAERASRGETVITEAPLLPSLLGLTEPAITSVTVPVRSGDRTTGSLMIEVDQTSAAEALQRAFSVAGMITVGLAVLAVAAIVLGVRRASGSGRRRAYRIAPGQQDPLTGLATRESFKAQLADAVEHATKADHQLGLMIVNLAEFRTVNDVWGHAAGDAVLKSAAERLRAAAGEAAAVARVSGDHFAVITERDASSPSLKQLAGKLHEALRAPYSVAESSITLGSNIGAALFPVNADNPDMLFRAADTALSKAKAEGLDSFSFFDTDMKRRMQRRATLERDLREALGRDEFVVFYQPQLELASGRLRGYEALLRWERPGEGILAPAEFLTVAQETGLIRPLGDWVLRKACADAVGWADGGVVAVNFCAAQFRFQDLEQSIAAALAETGLPAGRLEIEVPESLFLEQAPDILETLTRIKALGVRIAMDDFGAGYSGLSSLAHFPFDKIKIDKSFVSQLTEDADVAALVASIVGLGRSLTLDITAEGVETVEQVTLLKAAGCSIVQGFLFGAPKRTGDGQSEEAPAGAPEPASAVA